MIFPLSGGILLDRETRNELLTWVIAVFTTLGTVLVGYPLLKDSLPTPGSLYQFATGLIVLGFSVALMFMRKASAAPNLSTIDLWKKVTIEDKFGKRALVERGQKEIVNRDISNRNFVMKGLRSDGTIQNLKIDGVPLQPHETETSLGAIHVRKTWSELRRKGEIIQTVLSYEVIDTFLKEKETSAQNMAHTSPHLSIEINLPASRVCKIARAFLSYHGEAAQILKEPEVSKERIKISFERRKPKPGEEFVVEWEW